jgi:cytochrome c-type biogenesis protein
MLQQVGLGATLAAFAAGLASFFSPCVAPLVPAYLGYLSGGSYASSDGILALNAPRNVSRTLSSASFLFVGGFSAAFILLGLATASAGRLVVAYRPVLETIAGIVMLVMGTFLLGLLPRGLANLLLSDRRMRLSPNATSGLRAAGPFVLGLVFAAGWTPCIGPMLTTILAYVGASGNGGVGVWLLTSYSLGFAVPFLAVGFGWSFSLRALDWAKRHAHAISVASGVALILVGLVYLAGQGQIFAVWAQRLTPS